jgi:hypothetical protein
MKFLIDNAGTVPEAIVHHRAIARPRQDRDGHRQRIADEKSQPAFGRTRN